MDEQMERIEKMLRAQLRGTGHVWWIGGYVYGATSNDDLFIILYPAAENLKEKVVRVYDQDFKKLPRFIRTEGIDGGDTDANPSKEQAKKKGIFHECPAFEIVTFDGKDTQMGKERRFGDVLRLSRAARELLASGQTRTPTPSSEQPPAKSTQEPGTVPSPEPIKPMKLPDFGGIARAAKTTTEFDYAAFMALNTSLAADQVMYTDQERITRTREVLVPGWKPGVKSNEAMLHALGVYREKRQAAEKRGEATSTAHTIAKREAMLVYNREIDMK